MHAKIYFPHIKAEKVIIALDEPNFFVERNVFTHLEKILAMVDALYIVPTISSLHVVDNLWT